ncbi:MAG TPA: potassium channel family protein [Allosphingosinicella sp.]|jgi:voltage-gated potassium channel|uniref:potassium channel family protein n=1 Tax=Allosphingosinicella sp. TaxID=2823234 RepID=UPI002F2999CD
MTRARRPDRVTLRRPSPLPVWAQIAWRVAFVLFLLGLALGVHWLERKGLKDTHDGVVDFYDILYFTSISITTTGYGDIVPISREARMFDAFVVTPIRIFFVLIFIGTAYSLVFRRSWEKWRMERIQRALSGHVIIAGFGISGAEALDELLARGQKASEVVVVDPDPEALERPLSLGCAVVEADATRDKALTEVRVAEARAMIVAPGRDDTAILITLTARHLAPKLKISVAVRNADNELLARQAGATTVINPVSFAGLLLAGSTHGAHISDYIADLASSSGRVRLAEREVEPQECGKALQEVTHGLGVRVYRNGIPHGFWEPEARSLLPGDCIVEILPTLKAERDLG